MMRPITKKDVKRWKFTWGGIREIKGYFTLGRVIHIGHGWGLYAYAARADGNPGWVNKRTLERRAKLGWPKKRNKKPKQLLQDGPFSLEEMAIAEAIINGG